MICGDYDIGGLQVSRGFVQRQTIAGINVVIVGTKYSNKQSFLMRIISFLCFMFFSIWVGLKTKKVDVIYVTSTPLTVGIPAMALKFLKRVPFVFEVRDQWPEIPIEMGFIRSKPLMKILLWLEKVIYKKAEAIVALSPGIADGVRHVLQRDKQITVVPNSSDTKLFHPDVDGSAIRQEYGWGDKLVFMHFGAMGKANGLDFVVQAAERLKEKENIHFVILGDGSEKVGLIDKANAFGLENIDFTGSKPKTELPAFVAACDVSMVIFANHPILEHNSANKFFDSLSAGKLILLNYSGWQRKIIEESKAGFGCSLCDLDEFIEKITYLNSHRAELAEMGLNSRKIAEEHFNRDKLASQVLHVLEKVSS